jgi:hypothetical protein
VSPRRTARPAIAQPRAILRTRTSERAGNSRPAGRTRDWPSRGGWGVTSPATFTALVLAVGVERVRSWPCQNGMLRGRSHTVVRSSASRFLDDGACTAYCAVLAGCGCGAALPADSRLRARRCTSAICTGGASPRWGGGPPGSSVPGLPLVSRGPYHLLRHPNYLAVVLEGAASLSSAWPRLPGLPSNSLLARRSGRRRALPVAGKEAALR